MVSKEIWKFEASWCGPCHAVEPVVKKLAEQHGLPVVHIDIDEQPDVAEKYGVMSVPTIMVMEGGSPTASAIGAQPLTKLAQSLNLTD